MVKIYVQPSVLRRHAVLDFGSLGSRNLWPPWAEPQVIRPGDLLPGPAGMIRHAVGAQVRVGGDLDADPDLCSRALSSWRWRS